MSTANRCLPLSENHLGWGSGGDMQMTKAMKMSFIIYLTLFGLFKYNVHVLYTIYVYKGMLK